MSVALVALALGALLFQGARASAQGARLPVHVEVQGLFGENTILSDGYTPVLVTLENRGGRDLAGELELRPASYEGPLGRHVARVDLPSGAQRQLTITMFVAPDAAEVVARFEVDGRLLGRGSSTINYQEGARLVVVLGDPPRLRGALLDLDVEVIGPSGPQLTRARVGVVRLDPASADPMLPTEAAAWSSVLVLAASAPVLARASQAQREALTDWLRGGGRLLVFPRTASDLADPWLRALAGEIVEIGGPRIDPPAEGHDLVPPGVEHLVLQCSSGQRGESFGCSAPVGFGRVFLVSYDATRQDAIDTGVPRELVRSVYGAHEPAPPALLYGRQHDSLTQNYYGYGAPGSFGALRAALDPNESFRPALVLVALVLLLYVVVVGPLNFRWVQKKNRPTLALLTTPLAALSCLGLLLAVGYVGKGVSMRYRRFELIDLMEGEERGSARRYTGLFATRPGSFELPAGAPGEIAHRIEARGDRGPVHRHEGGGVRLADFRAALWETVFLREDRFVDLGGTIRFEGRSGAPTEVVNESALALSDAFLVDSSGTLYDVGDVPAGGRAPVSLDPRVAIPPGLYFDESTEEALEDALGVGSDERLYVRGIVNLVGTLAPASETLLYARVPARAGRLGGVFAPETDLRWIRVVHRTLGREVEPAPPPPTNSPSDPYRQLAEVPSDAVAADAAAADPGQSDAGVIGADVIGADVEATP